MSLGPECESVFFLNVECCICYDIYRYISVPIC
jgi:hypothetical protein